MTKKRPTTGVKLKTSDFVFACCSQFNPDAFVSLELKPGRGCGCTSGSRAVAASHIDLLLAVTIYAVDSFTDFNLTIERLSCQKRI